MSKEKPRRDHVANGLESEYDFTGGVRGKHYQAYRHGFRIIVHKVDGTTEERDYTLPEGAVVLDPDVRAYFPDSDAVDRALRGLIELIPSSRVPTGTTS